MNHDRVYLTEIPDFLPEFSAISEMRRLKNIGMSCGCEYTRLAPFAGLKPYSRFSHSLGAAKLVWRFTRDPKQTIAALYHDIASPVFAHTVDFLNGDHLTQESTESGTAEILRRSADLRVLLEKYDLRIDDIADYHRYPIADNDPPRLSADRLEYTLGNLVNYGRVPEAAVKAYVDDLLVEENESGQPELVFRQSAVAASFAKNALYCSKVYVSDAARVSMQTLADLLRTALDSGVLTKDDLLTDEPAVIEKLCGNPVTREGWNCFRALKATVRGEGKVIPAKKRRIDPLVSGKGRVSALDSAFADALDAFLAESLDIPVRGC